MRNPIGFTIFFSLLILLIDFYTYSGVKKLTAKYREKTRKIIFYFYWIVPVILIISLIQFALFYSAIDPLNVMVYFHYISGTFILFYLPKLVFILFNLFDDIIRLIKWTLVKLRRSDNVHKKGKQLSREQFLTKTGILLAGLPFLSIAYGIKWGRFNFTVRNHTLKFANLPKAFNGIKIVQVSDFHIGSFINSINEVETAVELINEQDADLILFTGDFVNNYSSEMDKFIPVLNRMEARTGKFSILGNHDYGEYVRWNSPGDKQNNLRKLISTQEDLGFKMLINNSHQLELNNELINIIGVENWGLPPFPQYGDLKKALSNVEDDSFKILLSHDPTHWDEEVLYKTNIDLTLSGHTHGAQFGIEIPGWRWSPVDMRYNRWGGLYKEDKQFLYVNTGIGFIGFPGRVGMPPEITVIELEKS